MNDPKDKYDDMERLIGLTHKAYMNASSGYFAPPTDIFETGEEIIVYIEIAGMKKEEIGVTFQNGYLFISGVRSLFCPECTLAAHRMEIDNGRFMRKIRIDIDIVVDKIEAEYREGILRISMPKKG